MDGIGVGMDCIGLHRDGIGLHRAQARAALPCMHVLITAPSPCMQARAALPLEGSLLA